MNQYSLNHKATRPFIDLSGNVYGRLTVLERVENKGTKKNWVAYRCKCECGNEVVCLAQNLRRGTTRSCGCLAKDMNRIKAQNNITHGMTNTRLYHVWEGIRDRVNNPNCKSYKHYGGRGIKMCEEWSNFSNFREWAISHGYDENAPHGKCTIDRIDVNGDYEPSNCRWITQTEQTLNSRHNHYIEFEGERLTVKEWSEKKGIPYQRLLQRINNLGWSVERALCE